MTAEQQPTPFDLAAQSYLSKGWSPIPIPRGAKAPPPVGYTGYRAQRASGADLAEWSEHGYMTKDGIAVAHNVALHLPDGVVGLDVDQYEGKVGGESLADLEARLGPLPPTFISTSRDPRESGIRLYRSRRLGRTRPSVAGPSIELIHSGHRYMLVAPSVHKDTGLPYLWYSPALLQVTAPRPTDLVVLPSEEWEDHLDTGDAADRPVSASVTAAEALRLLQGYPDAAGPMCQAMRRVVDRAIADLPASGSRHDTCRDLVLAAIRHGEMGHRGSVEAVVEIEQVFYGALRFGKERQPDPEEFERMITGGVAYVTGSPTSEADKGCCGGTATMPTWSPTAEQDAVWDARPELRHIHDFAWSQTAGPWGTLGVVLTRVLVAMPPHITIPAIVYGRAPLNYFCCLVGVSGMGKGGSESAARSAIDLGDIYETNVGSGEGIVHQYKFRDKTGVHFHLGHEQILFKLSEVDTLTALGQRQGSTILSALRAAWSGERLGASNADPARTIPVEAGTYRMGMLLHVQPGRAGDLFSDAQEAGGTTGRMLWMPTRDPSMPEVRPARPLPLKWTRPAYYPATAGVQDIAVCATATKAVLDNQLRMHREGSSSIDGQGLLVQLKTAAALGFLAGRLEVSEEDWQLSGEIMRVSLRTRDDIRESLRATATESNIGRAKADARRAIISGDMQHEAKVKRVVSRVQSLSTQWGEPVTDWSIAQMLASRDRDVLPEALVALTHTGVIEVVDLGGKVHYRGAVKS